MTEDAKTLIETAVRRFLAEVPALAPLKLVFAVELRGRGDVQMYRVQLPELKVTKGIAEDARPDVGSMAREPLDPGVSNAAQLDLSLGASEAPNNSPPQTDATQPVRR